MKNILDYGAVADGKTLNTAVIQAAIDAEAQAGGGTVVVPAGTYLTGTLRLRDNIELHLEPGAVLLASTDPKDYNALDEFPQNFSSVQEGWQGIHLILAVRVKNVSITGRGTIDGNGSCSYQPCSARPPKHGFEWGYGFRSAKDKDHPRPGQLLNFCECRNVLVSGVTLQNASCWCCYLMGCRDAVIEKLIIRNPQDAANTDGIDIDCCQNVMISNCSIETGDDSIAIRGCSQRLGYYFPCENITVANCVLASAVCGFRIGVGTGIIRNVVISNIMIRKAADGFLFQSAYSPDTGVDIYDVSVSNVRFDLTAYPVRVRSPYSTKATIHDLEFDHLHGNCFAGISVEGQEQARPHDITFRNCSFYRVSCPIVLAEPQDYPEEFLSVTLADNVDVETVVFHQK